MSDSVTLASVGNVLRAADLLTGVRGSEDVAVLGLAMDSAAARPGDLFLAWAGTRFDAHDFVASAVQNGAVATVVERAVEVDVPQLVVSNGRKAAALAASAVMGDPSRDMLAVGVTGTNGKTTTALLVRHLLQSDVPAAFIGTLGLIDHDDPLVRPGTEGLTTPGPVQVAVWLRELADGGAAAVVLEASSHALEQYRLDGVEFDLAIYTNLTQEHLDYHGGMNEYFAAKARLVDIVSPSGTVIVNGDEPAWSRLDTGPRTRRTYSIDGEGDVRAEQVTLHQTGSSFTLVVDGERHPVRSPLLGRYNIENALAAVTTAVAAGVPVERIAQRLQTAPHVSGRLEAVLDKPFTVLIDFAHTPAALENALAAIRPLTPGRLIVVFGAGGDRDATKRRPMGEAVARVADVVVVTSDNPRTEEPDAIIDDVVAGLEGGTFHRFVDRREAIGAALEMAEPGDTVVLAGKGHETYQVIGTDKHPFDEREIVRELLSKLGVIA